MGIGVSVFLAAVGAILTFAVQADVSGVSLDAIGVILMIAGGLGLLVSALFLASWAPFRRTEIVEERRNVDHGTPHEHVEHRRTA